LLIEDVDLWQIALRYPLKPPDLVLANKCLVTYMLRRSNENTTRMARTGFEMEELGNAFATIAFQAKSCMLI
jgi:hypothetical protein